MEPNFLYTNYSDSDIVNSEKEDYDEPNVMEISNTGQVGKENIGSIKRDLNLVFDRYEFFNNSIGEYADDGKIRTETLFSNNIGKPPRSLSINIDYEQNFKKKIFNELSFDHKSRSNRIITSASSNDKNYVITSQTSHFEKENYSCESENNINITKSECIPFLGETQKNSLINNSKFLFDNNTERNRKRSLQMRKIRSNHESKDFREDDMLAKFVKSHEQEVNGSECLNQQPHLILGFQTMTDEPIEVIVSDIDCSIEEDPHGSSNKSFIHMKNNLTTKNTNDNNLTTSYLLALNQCEEEEEVLDDIPEENGPYDSLNDKLRAKSKEYKHFRLPSGKNFLISSVIEEEMSEIYTDSELSKKRSLFLSKDHNSTDKIKSIRSSINLEKSLKIESSRSKLDQDILSRREIAKSEVFNFQFDLQKAFSEMSKKHLQKEEQSKLKLENKKRTLLENFKKSHSGNLEPTNKENTFYNVLKNIEIIEKPSEDLVILESLDEKQKLVINISTSMNKANKKSPSSLGREICYNNEIKENSIEDSDNKEKNLSNRNPIIEDKSMKSMRDLYKHHRKKSSFFPSEDLRISKIDSINYNILDTKTPDHCSFININNNINICSPISINSIKNNEQVENQGETDRTMINPMEILKGANLEFLTPDKPNDYTLSSNIKKQSINLNLTISRNDMMFNEHSNSSILKKKLFENGKEVAKCINNITIKGNFNTNLAVSNPINLEVLRE
jgi:hypothetical protein